MKLFEILKFDYTEYNKQVLVRANDNIDVPKNYSGFTVTIEMVINHSEILHSLKNVKNIVIENNIVKYKCLCDNNEIVMSVYDYCQRNFNIDNFILDFKKIIDTLNMWEIE